MNISDIVSMLDKKYHADPVACANEGKLAKMQCGYQTDRHGKLGVHGSSAYLVCGVCGFSTPTSQG